MIFQRLFHLFTNIGLFIKISHRVIEQINLRQLAIFHIENFGLILNIVTLSDHFENFLKNCRFSVIHKFNKPTKLFLVPLSQSKIGLEIENVIFRWWCKNSVNSQFLLILQLIFKFHFSHHFSFNFGKKILLSDFTNHKLDWLKNRKSHPAPPYSVNLKITFWKLKAGKWVGHLSNHLPMLLENETTLEKRTNLGTRWCFSFFSLKDIFNGHPSWF